KVRSVFRGVDDALYDSLTKRGIELGDPQTQLNADFSQTFNLSQRNYTLRVGKAQNKDGQELSVLFLYDGEKRQILFTNRTEDAGETLGYLHWVGDVDHDGRPDIYCSLWVGGESAENVLFLSSKAKAGNLVGKAAELWFVDNC